MKPGRRLANLALVAAGILLVVAAGEVVLRVFTPAVEGEDTLSRYTRFDASLGWRGIPSARGSFSTRHFTIQVEHNAGGFRGAEEGTPASELVAGRVVAVGDSYGWGFGVEQPEMFTSRLAEMRPDLEVINMGVSGYGLDQELLLLRESGFELRPEVVLVQICLFNDVFTILHPQAYGLPKPYFVLRNNELILEGVPVTETTPFDHLPRNYRVREWLTENVRVYGWGRLRWRRLRARWEDAREDRRDEMGRMKMLAREPDPEVERGWQLTELLLARLKDEAAGIGARVIVLAVADPLQVDDELWQRHVTGAGLDGGAYDRDLSSRRLADMGRSLEIPVVDPLERFREHAAGGKQLYIDDHDPHWNAAGHRLAAAELAAFFATAAAD